MLRILGWALAFAVHAHEAGTEPTDRLIPVGWHGNAWGPAATEARRNSQLAPIPITPLMTRWDRWGRQVLRDGDIVFRRGDAKVFFGYFSFSRFLAAASGSPYSHVGIVAIEEGEPVIYDTTKSGVRRQPFQIWVLDNVGEMGVKRLKAPYRSHIPAVHAFVRKAFETQVPFDYQLSMDDESLYCIELTEKAFRSAGLKLSDPVKLGDMENASKYPACMFLLQYWSRFVLDEPLSFEQPVFFPGNERHGIWSSPLLETVYPVRRAATTASKPARLAPSVARQAQGNPRS